MSIHGKNIELRIPEEVVPMCNPTFPYALTLLLEEGPGIDCLSGQLVAA
jgi:hypothetical protein